MGLEQEYDKRIIIELVLPMLDCYSYLKLLCSKVLMHTLGGGACLIQHFWAQGIESNTYFHNFCLVLNPLQSISITWW